MGFASLYPSYGLSKHDRLAQVPLHGDSGAGQRLDPALARRISYAHQPYALRAAAGRLRQRLGPRRQAVKLRLPHFLPPVSTTNRLCRSWHFVGSASASALASSFPALYDFQEALTL
jgi:hypothetical protein